MQQSILTINAGSSSVKFALFELAEHINEKEKIGKGSLKNFQKFGYGLSATVGTSFNNIILQFTYQRGLNKTIKKKKQYEQNMLLSLGYEF